MSKSNDFEADLLNLFFANANVANLGDATGVRGSSTAGSVYFALHTGDPGETGKQNTSEAAYTGYARVAVARSGTNFSATNGDLSLLTDVLFPAGTGGSGTATHWSCGYQSSGASKIMYSGALSPSIVMGNGVTPKINAGTIINED